PGQGVIYIQQISPEKVIFNSDLVTTSAPTGSLTIIEAGPDRLLLQAEDGTQFTFAFATHLLEQIN
ncbi:MAG: hypothetical protein H0S79_26670, partial [Anaerolineaceae bacterium]|nr:hypothetical protein [Anaerolineaceae bacterium]